MNNLEKKFQEKLKTSKVYLHFEDGTKFQGHCDRELPEGIWGEAAFTTSMSGYQETATDPSYLGQHIIFTTAHVGNYPADEKVMQSKQSFATSLIARNFSYNEFLGNSHIPLISGIDTRAITKFLTTTNYSHKAIISNSPEGPAKNEFSQIELVCSNLGLVSQDEEIIHTPGENPVVIINYGIKKAIIDDIVALGYPTVSVGHKISADEVIAKNPRLVFLSNGPGDPRNYEFEIEQVKKILSTDIPIRAICLGHQLISRALGADIEKLPYGHRGTNHPVLDRVTDKVMITSQNHGYAVTEESLNRVLGKDFIISHTSLFDNSVEGISSIDHKVKTVQFHPEASPGPKDAAPFFIEIADFLKGTKQPPIDGAKLSPIVDIKKRIYKKTPFKRILLIGSGPIKIGQASEFDYSGTQACKALKEEGIEVVLLNSNPATIMTDPEMAYRTYIEPINPEMIKKIALQEKVDAVISTMGGQTALNACVDLEEEGFFEKSKIRLLGASSQTIHKTEDRALFAKELDKLGYQTGKRFTAKDQEDAITLAKGQVGFPLIIRRDFALGGKGAALVYDLEELMTYFTTDLEYPITLEKSLVGQKEVELEVMVDNEQNGVVICSIENIDPCGVHTGDSITVAPAQTISDHCYQQLRTMSLTIAKHMGVVAGGANVQFAINPDDENDITVIEMNPRVSRSSALASKATGYPIAKISALLAIGYTLKEILNDITKASPVAFEPTLDYVAIKIPIFPFHKFPSSSRKLGPQMRSVGEVLALGSNFNEAFIKALRSLEMGLEIPKLSQLKTTPFDMDETYLKNRLKGPHELSLLTVLEALRSGISADEIYEITKITPWFIAQAEQIIHLENLLGHDYNDAGLLQAKQFGFADKYIALITNRPVSEILDYRLSKDIRPSFRAVDTCSGEFSAQTPYFYSTFQKENEAVPLKEKGASVVVLGSGPNRIGQGIEFDYSCVKACQQLNTRDRFSIMINSNPETVSTDYDSSDRLYLSPVFSEDVFDILMHEDPSGVITTFSGQTGIKVREHIEKDHTKLFSTFNFLGPSLETLERTEDRKLFAEVIDKLELGKTKSLEVRGHKELVNALLQIGLPVIIRPSYVIGGESMYIFRNHDDIHKLPEELKDQLKHSSTTFLVETYLENSLEYDVDLVRDEAGNCTFTLCEHIEYAGVHSGDSGMITPAVAITSNLYEKMREVSIQMANELNIIGPTNIQFAIKDGTIYCIEANPRGSRTLPFLSKAYNISLPAIATDAMLGLNIESMSQETSPFFFVKQSTFPFDRFIQDNIVLGPKMRSTGETMGVDCDKEHAMLKSYIANYPGIHKKGKFLISLSDPTKSVLLPYLKALNNSQYELMATPGTAKYIRKQGIPCKMVGHISSPEDNLLEVIKHEDLKAVFNTPLDMGQSKSDGEYIRNTAIQHGVPCFTRVENITALIEALLGTKDEDIKPISLQEVHS